MPVTRRYECPDCQGEFTELHMSRDEPPPAECPLCGLSMTDEPTVLPPFIKIGTHRGKTPDKVYRQMEAASEARAEMAAEQLGVSKAEVSDMKITNMKDSLRPGDTAAVLPPPKYPVAQTSYQNPDAAMAFAASAKTGPYAGTGLQTLGAIKETHAQRAAALTAAGRQGRYAPT